MVGSFTKLDNSLSEGINGIGRKMDLLRFILTNSLIPSYVHSFSKHLLNIYHMPRTDGNRVKINVNFRKQKLHLLHPEFVDLVTYLLPILAVKSHLLILLPQKVVPGLISKF